MEYFNNILCITQPELLEVMSKPAYDQLVNRRKVQVAQRACRGRKALIVFDSLPGKYRLAVKERKPDISTMPLQEWLRANYTPDAEARSYFSAFRFDNGSVVVPTTPGLGVELDQDKLAELHEAFKVCRIRTRNDVVQMQRFRPDWKQIKPRF